MALPSKKTGKIRITWHWGVFMQPLLQWKINDYYITWVYVCSLRYPACNAHAPSCHLWPAPLYNIFPLYFINGTIFDKKLLNIKRVFWFPPQISSETFLILRRIQRSIIIVATYFGLIRPSAGQHSAIWGTISTYHVLWDHILLTGCT